MLIRTREPAAKALGEQAVKFIGTWPHGVEIDEFEKRVYFYNAAGDWVVGYSFETVRVAAADPKFTPQALRRLVAAHLDSSQRSHELGRAVRRPNSGRQVAVTRLGNPYQRNLRDLLIREQAQVFPMRTGRRK